MTLHCDSCRKSLGTYLYGKGGIEERAHILGKYNAVALPDIVCNECWAEGYTTEIKKVNDHDWPEKDLSV